MKPYQLIGFPERDMADFEQSFERCIKYEPSQALGQIAYAHTSYVVCHHLDLMPVPTWRSHAKACCEKVFSTIGETGFLQPWFEPMHCAMLCGSYAGNWNELKQLAGVNAYLFEEDYLGTAPRELQYILLDVLYSLSTDPFLPSAEARAAVDNLSNKKARRYLDLWCAVKTNDQQLFESLLKDSVEKFARRKKPPANATFPLEWIASFESIVVNFALRSGMAWPNLPKKQKPVLMISD